LEEQMARAQSDAAAKRSNRGASAILHWVTGLAWLAAAGGVLIDVYYHEIYCVSCRGEGSIGLIPLYFGVPLGAIAFVLLLWRDVGRMPALLAALGAAGILYFMGTYPWGADGWIGAILIGVAHLFLPLSGRFAAILWTIAGALGFPEFGEPTWGLISAFTVFGAALALSGAFVLWGWRPAKDGQISAQEAIA
jgi:hypothetical protein